MMIQRLHYKWGGSYLIELFACSFFVMVGRGGYIPKTGHHQQKGWFHIMIVHSKNFAYSVPGTWHHPLGHIFPSAQIGTIAKSSWSFLSPCKIALFILTLHVTKFLHNGLPLHHQITVQRRVLSCNAKFLTFLLASWFSNNVSLMSGSSDP